MSKRILVVLTSADQITADKPTGWYLPELAHPYKVLVDAGFTNIDIISPKGGKAPLDPGSAKDFKDDPACKWFLADSKAQSLVNNTKTAGQVKASDYHAVLYPGGHGPMFDLANDTAIAQIASSVYEQGGIVAAVCHGPAGLIHVKLPSGEPIVKGKKVTCFTNAEEDLMQLTQLMPFALETKLKELGAIFEQQPLFKENVLVDGRLITGQNPASSTGLGQAIVAQLKK